MRFITIKARSGSRLSEITEAVKSALDEIYEHKREDIGVVVQCEHMEDCAYGEDTIQTMAGWEKAVRQLEMADTIIIFVSDGDVFGHSFDLLLISDFRILRTDARAGFSPLNGAILPRMSLYRLANQVGQAHARRVGLWGKALGANECSKLGLVDELSKDVTETLDRALDKFGNASASEMAIRRRLILEAHALEYDDALGAHLAACARRRSGIPA